DCLKQGLVQLPGQPDLLWDLASLLSQLKRTEEAKQTIDRLADVGVPPAFQDCLRAELEMVAKDWKTAAETLERAFPALVDLQARLNDGLSSQLALRAGLSLARCYEELGDTDRAQSTFSRLIARDSHSIPAIRGLARSLMALGRYQEAIDQYKQLAR